MPTVKAVGSATRIRTLDVTQELACRVARKIPVTRLADITPLDRLDIPVYCAVTPLARDLTTHMGKGADHQAARVSALMEAIERFSAEAAPPNSIRARACDLEATDRIIDPTGFDLPPDTTYSRDKQVHWTQVFDLLGGETGLLPTDLIICPPREGVLAQPDTNGLASGNTKLEATVHALCEVIERDAMGQWAFTALYQDGDEATEHPIDSATVPLSCRDTVERAFAEGFLVDLALMKSNITIPVIHAVITDPRFISAAGPAPRRFDGFGCHPNTEIALSRALNEAVQSRLAIIQGGRDSYNRLPRGLGASAETGDRQSSGAAMSFEAVETIGSTISPTTSPTSCRGWPLPVSIAPSSPIFRRRDLKSRLSERA